MSSFHAAGCTSVVGEAWRADIDDLLEIQLKTPTGATPRVQELTEPYYEQHYASLHHNNGRPSIVVSAAFTRASASGNNTSSLLAK